MNIWFIIALVVWIASGSYRSIYELRKYRRFNPDAVDLRESSESESRLEASKAVFRMLMFSMFFMWSSWVFMCFDDPVKINEANWNPYPGIVLTLIGVLIFILSETTKGSVVDEGFLVTKGLYTKIRHPMYVGQFLMAVGFALFGGGLVTLCLSTLWLVQLLIWRAGEERELLTKYPHYREYKKRTWF